MTSICKCSACKARQAYTDAKNLAEDLESAQVTSAGRWFVTFAVTFISVLAAGDMLWMAFR